MRIGVIQASSQSGKNELLYHCTCNAVEHNSRKDEVINYVKTHDFEVLIVLGAGDLDNMVPQITKILKTK